MMGEGEVISLKDDVNKFIKGDYPVENVDENEALQRLSKKNRGVVIITITPKFATKALTKAEDVVTLELTDERLEENIKTIKSHMKKLTDSKVIDKMMTKVMEEIKHG